MKKIFGIVFSFIILSLPVFSAENVEWTTKTGLERVEKIGKNLLTKNNLPTQVTFSVVETDEINAFASGDNEICVYTGLLKFVETLPQIEEIMDTYELLTYVYNVFEYSVTRNKGYIFIEKVYI